MTDQATKKRSIDIDVTKLLGREGVGAKVGVKLGIKRKPAAAR